MPALTLDLLELRLSAEGGTCAFDAIAQLLAQVHFWFLALGCFYKQMVPSSPKTQY